MEAEAELPATLATLVGTEAELLAAAAMRALVLGAVEEPEPLEALDEPDADEDALLMPDSWALTVALKVPVMPVMVKRPV